MLNLATDRIWRFQDDKRKVFLLSLPDVLRADFPLYHSPTPSYLEPIQHELLASILQVATDSLWKKGISKKNFAQLIQANHYREVRSIINSITCQLQQIKGFNLFGNGAFMQMPTAWRLAGKKSQIARLMWPFIPNVDGSSKGLRRLPTTPKWLSADLTALYLFSSCVLSKGGLQYWTIGNLAGRILLHQHQATTLRQQLFCAVLPGFSQSWKPLQPLAWVPNCKNRGGLEFSELPPFAKHLFGKSTIKGTANIRFYQARAIILDPPDNGTCDITGERGIVFSSCRYLTDKTVHKQLIQKKCSTTLKKAGILTQMYLKTDHPCVANYVDKESEAESALLSLSAWSKCKRLKVTLPSTVEATKSVCKQTEKKGIDISFFHLKYIARKQDVNDLIHFNSKILFSTSARYKSLNSLEEIILTAISRVRAGLYFLLTEKKGKTLKKDLTNLLHQETELCFDLLIRSILEAIKQNHNRERESMLRVAKSICYNNALNWWFGWLEINRRTDAMRLSDHQKTYSATHIALGDISMYPDNLTVKSMKAVRAGRAFASAFIELTPVKQAECLADGLHYTSRYFWQCFNKALREDPNLYQPLYEQILTLLKYVTPVEDGTDIGTLLSGYNGTFRESRVEQLLLEDQQDLLVEQILYIFHDITKAGRYPVQLDFGIFCYDLKTFHFDKDSVRRRWAFQYFTSTHQTEKD